MWEDNDGFGSHRKAPEDIQEYWHHIQQPQGYHQSVERVQRQARRKTSRNKSWR